MTDLDTPPAETRPLRAVVRFWPMSFALAFVGLVAGIGVGAAKPPIYTAETRLAIGAQGLSSYAIPGFALAAQELAADYARYVSLAQDGSALKSALGSRASEIVGLSASPVPNSSVVSVEAQSADSALALKAATAVGATLIAATNVQTNEQAAAVLLTQYTALSAQVAQANQVLVAAQTLVTKLLALPTATAAQIEAAQAADADAATKYAALQLQQTALGNKYQSVASSNTPSSNLSVVEPAVILFNNTTKNEELYGLVGLAGGAAISMLAATIRSRIVKRRRAARANRPESPNQPHEKSSYLAEVIANTGGSSSKNEPMYREPAATYASGDSNERRKEAVLSATSEPAEESASSTATEPVTEKNWARETVPRSSRFARPIAAPSVADRKPPANGSSARNGEGTGSGGNREGGATSSNSGRKTETTGNTGARNSDTIRR